MEELMWLLNKSKKEVTSYLKENNISYAYSKKTLTYTIKLLDEEFEVNARVFSNTITSVELRCTSVKSSNFKDLVITLKEYMNNKFGIPEMDNTNHDAENVEVNYRIDNGAIFLYGNEKHNGLYVQFYSFEKRYSANLLLVRWLIYFVSSFLLGHLIYLFTLDEYSWNSFVICMIGAATFALLVLYFEFVEFREKKLNDKKIDMHKYDSKFEEYEKTIDFDMSYCCTVLPKTKPARIYFKDKDVNIAYYRRGLKCINTNLEMIDKKLLSWGIVQVNNNVILYLDDEDAYYALLDYIKDKLYDNEKFNVIYDKIDKAFREYNPYSILNNGDIYKSDVFLFSKEIYYAKEVTRESIIFMLDDLFDDMDEIMVNEFTNVILEELNKNQ